MPTIERNDHLTELVIEVIDAENKHCPECGDTAPKDKLLVFYTKRGNKQRQHDGVFCSKQCHDVWHGLAPRNKAH